MKKNEYIVNLMTQFALSKGIKHADMDSKLFLDEFSNWLLEMKKKGVDYLSFIDCLDTHPTVFDSSTAEIGKGEYDSVALGNTNITLITPYLGTSIDNSQSIIGADFKVIGSSPILVKEGIKYDGDMLSRFMTQNPDCSNKVLGWENLHNSGLSNITVGVFGDIHDKDVDRKIKIIKSLKDKMSDDSFVEDYVTDKDSYYYAISSNRKTLRRRLSR